MQNKITKEEQAQLEMVTEGLLNVLSAESAEMAIASSFIAIGITLSQLEFRDLTLAQDLMEKGKSMVLDCLSEAGWK